jgi:hypothetical protein
MILLNFFFFPWATAITDQLNLICGDISKDIYDNNNNNKNYGCFVVVVVGYSCTTTETCKGMQLL